MCPGALNPYIVYSAGKVRKVELESEVFRDMVHAIGDKNTPILGRWSPIYYIDGEWNSFLKFLKGTLAACHEKALGKAEAQAMLGLMHCLRDGGPQYFAKVRRQYGLAAAQLRRRRCAVQPR